jgi:hypothetical protein
MKPLDNLFDKFVSSLLLKKAAGPSDPFTPADYEKYMRELTTRKRPPAYGRKHIQEMITAGTHRELEYSPTMVPRGVRHVVRLGAGAGPEYFKFSNPMAELYQLMRTYVSADDPAGYMTLPSGKAMGLINLPTKYRDISFRPISHTIGLIANPKRIGRLAEMAVAPWEEGSPAYEALLQLGEKIRKAELGKFPVSQIRLPRGTKELPLGEIRIPGLGDQVVYPLKEVLAKYLPRSYEPIKLLTAAGYGKKDIHDIVTKAMPGFKNPASLLQETGLEPKTIESIIKQQAPRLQRAQIYDSLRSVGKGRLKSLFAASKPVDRRVAAGLGALSALLGGGYAATRALFGRQEAKRKKPEKEQTTEAKYQ